MRISDWSSDVCSSDLHNFFVGSRPALRDLGDRCCAVSLEPGVPHEPRVRSLTSGDFACQHDLEGDRKRVVSGKSVSVRVDLGGRHIIKKKNIIKDNDQTRCKIISRKFTKLTSK